MTGSDWQPPQPGQAAREFHANAVNVVTANLVEVRDQLLVIHARGRALEEQVFSVVGKSSIQAAQDAVTLVGLATKRVDEAAGAYELTIRRLAEYLALF